MIKEGYTLREAAQAQNINSHTLHEWVKKERRGEEPARENARIRDGKGRAWGWLKRVAERQPHLYVHWKAGFAP